MTARTANHAHRYATQNSSIVIVTYKTSRVVASVIAALLVSALLAGCGSSGTDHGPVTDEQAVTGTLPPPLRPSTTAAPDPAPSGTGGDSTSQSSSGSSEGGFAMQGRKAVRFTYQGFQYDMIFQNARESVDGDDIEASAPHGYVWIIATFYVRNLETDRRVPVLDTIIEPEAQVRRAFATTEDQKDDPVETSNNNCKAGWCGVHTTTSGAVVDGQFQAVPCSTCEMGVGSEHGIKAAYLVREGLEGDDIRFYVPSLAPYGKAFEPASRRLA